MTETVEARVLALLTSTREEIAKTENVATVIGFSLLKGMCMIAVGLEEIREELEMLRTTRRS